MYENESYHPLYVPLCLLLLRTQRAIVRQTIALIDRKLHCDAHSLHSSTITSALKGFHNSILHSVALFIQQVASQTLGWRQLVT
jgi:hypothetical protein